LRHAAAHADVGYERVLAAEAIAHRGRDRDDADGQGEAQVRDRPRSVRQEDAIAALRPVAGARGDLEALRGHVTQGPPVTPPARGAEDRDRGLPRCREVHVARLRFQAEALGVRGSDASQEDEDGQAGRLKSHAVSGDQSGPWLKPRPDRAAAGRMSPWPYSSLRPPGGAPPSGSAVCSIAALTEAGSAKPCETSKAA